MLWQEEASVDAQSLPEPELSLWSDHSSQSFCLKTPDYISGPYQTDALD